MPDLEKQIKELLSAEEKGLTAREIAKRLDVSKGEVNSIFYGNSDVFFCDDSKTPLWSVINHSAGTDPLLLKLQNRDGAKTFKQKDFDSLADWSYGKSHSKDRNGTYITRSGNRIEYDSKHEWMLMEYLEKHDLAKDLGGQSLCIPYNTSFREHVKYYPDIVAYTKDDHIAIFEVKTRVALDKHTCMEKYNALAAYCEEHGFMYMMVDPMANFTTFEELRDMEVCAEFLEWFNEWIDEEPDDPKAPYKHFDDEDVRKWYKEYGSGFSFKNFERQVHSIVMFYGWHNFSTYGFNVYSRPVKLDRKTFEVIDYE